MVAIVCVHPMFEGITGFFAKSMKTGHSVTICNLVKICGHKRRAPSSGQMESAATEEIIMSSTKPG